ncbi:glutathione S-transferase N-terminal domain-containing protein [Sphingopyxis sp. XHP0097]|uniref:Glutathione S-transferase N-terminal domain-containing protein n=1 Tax=Sphingopyxis jiangsuensis TaxID=2871171 RepID=A0ABS7MH22_9SPHN|nr:MULTISPECIES: glutathione S-transferase N-terminal domain-containing protein [Sphingopyxis]MBL0768585.1 glutathione S-transferase N-terminal domain-containing protein [Sphingopyxis lutea]MBY4638306.1 glutathione S-transferase N-terminal domain-containing protein [Sphingopyxis jiangsuensis]
MITLYGGPTPNARKIAIALLEMDLEWQLEPVDILAGDQLTPAFLALNPNNKTPVIVDDDGPAGPGFVLWETGAILLYLAEKTGRFLPADPVKRALCWQWLMFQLSGIGPMFGQAAHFTHYAKDRHDYAIDRYTREVDRLMMVLDKRLGETEWLAGDEYSIADMATLPYLRRQLIDNGARFPNVARWGAAMFERPAVAEGMTVGVARAETIEGGLTGFTDEHRAILWGDRQHAPR